MSTMVPAARPEMSRASAEFFLAVHGVTGPALLGRRGYYRDTMGVPGVNDRGLYDDAIALVTPTAFVTFNANTDPSRSAPGMAVLVPGRYLYRVGTHGITKPKARQYEALVQADAVTIRRDGRAETERGWIGLNIHRGGINTTGSEGCQTIHPEQWPAFIALVKAEMECHGRTTIPYVLTEREAAS